MIELTADLSKTMDAEINAFEQAVQDFLSQKISDSKFQRIRLQHGVYGQRQDGVQMIRIKVPSGGLTTEQFEAIADVCEKYSKGITHITTRQDFQVHFVKVTDVPALMRTLAKVGVTTREACGNTVRNVTACPHTGVSATEVFDVAPYAVGFAKHMLRNPICQNMGRKFKVAFEGCVEDHARLRIHDIGFWAREKDGKRGFEVQIAGGLGATPSVSHLYTEFMPPEEIIPFSEAVLRVFDRHGERKIRSKARMKFVVKKFGFDKFKEMVEAERKALRVEPHWNDYLKSIKDISIQPDHGPVGKQVEPSDDFAAWQTTNALSQKQANYSTVTLRNPLGDMVPSQMRRLAELTREYGNGLLHVSIEQNMLLHWVHNSDLASLYEELKKIDLHHGDAETVYDVLACPGTDTCRLGISGSRPLATAITERLKAENGQVSKLANDVHIKISGCPNSCGQHHLGQIGFHGAALPQTGHIAPAFQLHIGGSASAKETTIGQIVMKIPSKNVPDATVKLITHYEANHNEGEDFNAFYARIERKATMELLAEYEHVPSFDENPEFYQDWGDQKEFGLQKGVVGECAGSPVSDVVPLLSDATPLLEQAKALLSHGEFEAASIKAYEGMARTADVALYTKMVQSFNDTESIQEFDNHFVRTGDFETLNNFRYDLDDLISQASSESSAKALVDKASQMMELCQAKFG